MSADREDEPTSQDANAESAGFPESEEVLDSNGRRIEKFCPKCYVFRTPKENFCISCGTKLKEIKLKSRTKK